MTRFFPCTCRLVSSLLLNTPRSLWIRGNRPVSADVPKRRDLVQQYLEKMSLSVRILPAPSHP